MTVRVASITFDCADALVLGSFWSAALDRPLDPKASGDFASIDFGGAETRRDGHRGSPTMIRPGNGTRLR